MPGWHRLFGVDVTPITIAGLMSSLELAIEQSEQLVVFTQNLHGAYLQLRNPDMRAAYDVAGLSYIDGMPFVWHGRLLGLELDQRHRTTYLDWYPRFYAMAEKLGWRVYYLGGTAESFKLSAGVLHEQFPRLEFDGRDGYFNTDVSGQENTDILADIQRFNPDVLIVGMGMPRQEQWVADNLALIDAPAIVTVGAGNDYLAGTISTPPRWMGRIGIEWLYRLVTEPQRLWHRYLVEPALLVPVWAREVITTRVLRRPAPQIRRKARPGHPADHA